MSHPYLSFSDSTFTTGKLVGSSAWTSAGNGLKDKSITKIEIPSLFEGVKVVEVGYGSFRDTSIISVFIPKTIQYIRFCAFFNCQSLNEVKFEVGSELKKMGKDVFEYTHALTKIDIPPSLEELEYDSNNYLFYGTTSLTCFSYFGSTDFSSAYVFGNIGCYRSLNKVGQYERYGLAVNTYYYICIL